MKLIKISGIVLGLCMSGLMMADGKVRIGNSCMSTVGTITWTVTNSEGGSHSRAVPFGEIGVSTIKQGIKLKRIKIKWASGSGKDDFDREVTYDLGKYSAGEWLFNPTDDGVNVWAKVSGAWHEEEPAVWASPSQ